MENNMEVMEQKSTAAVGTTDTEKRDPGSSGKAGAGNIIGKHWGGGDYV